MAITVRVTSVAEHLQPTVACLALLRDCPYSRKSLQALLGLEGERHQGLLGLPWLLLLRLSPSDQLITGPKKVP